MKGNTLKDQTRLQIQRQAFASKALCAHRTISMLMDDNEDSLYAENGIMVRISPDVKPSAQICRGVKDRFGVSICLSITAQSVGEAAYILLDTVEAAKLGSLDSVIPKCHDLVDADICYMSGYPQICGWARDGIPLQ